MIIQKINYSPNFSAKTEYVNTHDYYKNEPQQSTRVRKVLEGEPNLEENQVYRITRAGFSGTEDGEEVSFDELNLAIHDKDGKRISDPTTIYRRRVNFNSVAEDYTCKLDAKQIAAELRANIVAKAKAAFEALKKHADSLGYDLVKKVI